MPTAQLPRAAHTSSILVEVHWLPIQKRFIVKVLLITYKASSMMLILKYFDT